MKDPAFLFYSKDFYEGTRLMLPDERACYIDLLIYQHQHGYIPNDIKRLTLYCSGINEATLEATLKAKFKQSDKGWYNLVLHRIIDERLNFKSVQSENGVLGQFYKKAKSQLKSKQYNELKTFIVNNYGKENLIIELKKEETTHEAMLEALLKHLEDVNVNEDVIKNSTKDNNYYRVIGKLKLSFNDFDKLIILDYSKKQIDDTLDSIENYKGNTKYTSLYLTAKKWLSKEIPANKKPEQKFYPVL